MITFEELLASPPKLHAYKAYGKTLQQKLYAEGELINSWKLSDEELIFINGHINENSKTIETGAGCSTVFSKANSSRSSRPACRRWQSPAPSRKLPSPIHMLGMLRSAAPAALNAS